MLRLDVHVLHLQVGRRFVGLLAFGHERGAPLGLIVDRPHGAVGIAARSGGLHYGVELGNALVEIGY
ncbi:MAG TPA: hypothetical protein VGJ20_27775 [Xanthobacteraceae bacterium]